MSINHCTTTTHFTSKIKKHCKDIHEIRVQISSLVASLFPHTGISDVLWSRMATGSEIPPHQRNPEWKTYFSGSACSTHHADIQGSTLLSHKEFSACHIFFLTSLRAYGGLGHSLPNMYIFAFVYKESLF